MVADPGIVGVRILRWCGCSHDLRQMTEEEHVNATNLVRVRTAMSIVGQVTPLDDHDPVKEQVRTAYIALRELEKTLDPRVTTS